MILESWRTFGGAVILDLKSCFNAAVLWVNQRTPWIGLVRILGQTGIKSVLYNSEFICWKLIHFWNGTDRAKYFKRICKPHFPGLWSYRVIFDEGHFLPFMFLYVNRYRSNRTPAFSLPPISYLHIFIQCHGYPKYTSHLEQLPGHFCYRTIGLFENNFSEEWKDPFIAHVL